MKRIATSLLGLLLATPLSAQLSAPSGVVAGQEANLGKGKGDLLVFGPGMALRRSVRGEIRMSGEELSNAGRYVAILGDEKATFFVKAGEASKLSFIARPSRVPVSQPDVVIGVAFVFDGHQNLILDPTKVKFGLTLAGSKGLEREMETRNGVAWVRTASGSREGPAAFTVAFVKAHEGSEVKRVVQQVASDPCNIRMRAQRKGDTVEVVTDPVHDCSGNPVPDGTIVTFSQLAPNKLRSTVDARIKRGVARATLPAIDGATITVASGVVLGNEIRLGGRE
jgi:hypothetical protein